jgi:hypothetical protein
MFSHRPRNSNLDLEYHVHLPTPCGVIDSACFALWYLEIGVDRIEVPLRTACAGCVCLHVFCSLAICKSCDAAFKMNAYSLEATCFEFIPSFAAPSMAKIVVA